MADIEKDLRLKIFVRESIRQNLLKTGRAMVEEKGADYLTARKLSETSNCSVGTIYNQFSNMDNFIMAQNVLTLEALYADMEKIIPEKNAYNNLNRYVEAMVNFILNNRNLWRLLFDYHLRYSGNLPFAYRRVLEKVVVKCGREFDNVVNYLQQTEKKLSWQVLWSALFSMSSLLVSSGFEKLSRVKQKTALLLMLNTYLAGLNALKRKKL